MIRAICFHGRSVLGLGGVVAVCLMVVLPVYAGGSGSVFPGAVGFGVDTAAGRGGRVIKVTNLNRSGPGSFAEAVAAKGARIVVFEVGGVIDLERHSLSIKEPMLTVGGYPSAEPTTRTLDVPRKNIEEWLQGFSREP